MVSSISTNYTQVPQVHHFALVDGIRLQINASRSSNGCNAKCELQRKNCSRTWILHWGWTYHGNRLKLEHGNFQIEIPESDAHTSHLLYWRHCEGRTNSTSLALIDIVEKSLGGENMILLQSYCVDNYDMLAEEDGKGIVKWLLDEIS